MCCYSILLLMQTACGLRVWLLYQITQQSNSWPLCSSCHWGWCLGKGHLPALGSCTGVTEAPEGFSSLCPPVKQGGGSFWMSLGAAADILSILFSTQKLQLRALLQMYVLSCHQAHTTNRTTAVSLTGRHPKREKIAECHAGPGQRWYLHSVSFVQHFIEGLDAFPKFLYFSERF